MSIKLLPCPFCGSKRQGIDSFGVVTCLKCHATAEIPEGWNLRASPQPVQGAVAWRAWGSPWSNKPENQCWCYWDEYPETIPNSPDFTKFQALYTHPATGQELREELERLIDKWQDQRSGRPGWNAQQDCADDLRALLSRSTKEGEV